MSVRSEASRQARRLTVRASAPNLNDRAQFQSIDIDRLTLERLREKNELLQYSVIPRPPTDDSDGDEHGLDRLNPLKDTQYRALISAPLIAGTEQLGLINCYTNRQRRFSADDQTLLTTIANQAAIAIKNSYLVNQLAQKNLVKGFFDDLMLGSIDSEDSLRQRAHFLGCDLTRPHAAVMLEITHVEIRSWDEATASRKKGLDQMNVPASGNYAAYILIGNQCSAIHRAYRLQATYKRMSGIIRRRIQDSYPARSFMSMKICSPVFFHSIKILAGHVLKTWLQESG